MIVAYDTTSGRIVADQVRSTRPLVDGPDIAYLDVPDGVTSATHRIDPATELPEALPPVGYSVGVAGLVLTLTLAQSRTRVRVEEDAGGEWVEIARHVLPAGVHTLTFSDPGTFRLGIQAGGHVGARQTVTVS